MIAVMFEVELVDAGAYLGIAAELRPLLDGIDGFISIERFQSMSAPEKILSLSFWRDEAAVARWRMFEAHRAAQERARSHVLRNYRLRVATVVRDYGMHERTQAPADSRRHHSPSQS